MSSVTEQEVASALRACSLFQKSKASTIALVARKAAAASFAPDEVIFSQGEESSWMYILVRGHVRVQNEQITLSQNKSPGYVGGMTSMCFAADLASSSSSSSGSVATSAAASSSSSSSNAATIPKRSLTHQAVAATTIVKIDVALFRELSSVDADFSLAMMRYFAERLRSKNSRLASMMLEAKSGGKAGGGDGGGEPPLIITVYDTKPYDRVNLDKAFVGASFGGKKVHMHYLEVKCDETTISLAAGSDAICTFVNDTVDAQVLKMLKVMGIGIVLNRCAGFNNVDLAVAASLGISVARVPAYSPYAVAEHAFALLLSVTRRTHLAYQRTRSGDFTLDGLTGRDLFGLTVGVVGTGKIGQCFANIAKGVGMKIKLWDGYPNHAFAKQVGGEYISDFGKLCEVCDVISFHVPLLKATYHLLSRDVVQKHSRPGQVIINTSRGPVVDTEALLDGILSGKLGGAGLDVYEFEQKYFFENRSNAALQDSTLARLVNLPNVLVTSHQAFLTTDALGAIAQTTKFNATEFFQEGKRGGKLTNACLPPPPPKSKI